MWIGSFCAHRVSLIAASLGAALLAEGAVLQVGTGGMTSPASWSSGATVTDGFTALTASPAAFGALFDSASGLVGGGAVTGDLYYAFTARSLDRSSGNPYIPTNSLPTTPYAPGTSFGGGQLIGASPSLSIGEALGFWAYSYSIGTNGEGTRGDLSPRSDVSPARVELFEVHLHYNAAADDNATVVIRIYDNLPGQRQPNASDVPVGTYTNTLPNGNYAFSSFRFASGHADTTPYTRWRFSNVAFAQNPGEAADYVLAHGHTPVLKALVQLGTGGVTNEVAACSPATNFFAVTALTVNPAAFGALVDAASGRVGGGAVSGEVFYAFTARSLDRTGDTCLPAGSTAYVPNSPGRSCGGGQLAGANPSLGLGQKYGNWGMGFFTATNGAGGGDFGPRIDTATARVSLFEVRLTFNPSANDTATVIHYAFDNLPGQRQPTAADIPAHVRTLTVSGDYSFDRFLFVTGHTESKTTRWVFSNVVFTREPATAALYLLDPPRGLLIAVR
jgi:hypothetical protein